MRTRWEWAGALALVLTGCSTYYGDLQTICDAPHKVALPPGADPAAKAVQLGDYLAKNVRTDKGRDLVKQVALTADPGARGALIRAEAKAVGINTCPISDEVFVPTPTPPPTPAVAAATPAPTPKAKPTPKTKKKKHH